MWVRDHTAVDSGTDAADDGIDAVDSDGVIVDDIDDLSRLTVTDTGPVEAVDVVVDRRAATPGASIRLLMAATVVACMMAAAHGVAFRIAPTRLSLSNVREGIPEFTLQFSSLEGSSGLPQNSRESEPDFRVVIQNVTAVLVADGGAVTVSFDTEVSGRNVTSGTFFYVTLIGNGGTILAPVQVWVICVLC